MDEKINVLLHDLRARLQTLYGERFVRLVLYGSHARGEAHDESDVDVMVVLRGPVEPAREIRRAGMIRTEVGLAYDELISIFPVSEEDLSNKDALIFQNARREGIPI